jgi:transcriptional regulator with XRE-family HTH domain
MARKKQPANVVGTEIQKHRNNLGLTQEQFATKCQLHGLNISRGTVSQIEAQLRCVIDSELFLLASILGVSTESLYSADFKASLRKNKIQK